MENTSDFRLAIVANACTGAAALRSRLAAHGFDTATVARLVHTSPLTLTRAIKTGATVIPIGLWGTPEALPKGAFFLRPATIGLVVGDPMPTAGLTAADRNRFTEALQQQVGKLRDRAQELGTRKQ